MDGRVRETIWFVAVQLVFATALLHLALGLLNWIRWFNAGFLFPQDLRWPVFVISALFIYYGLHRALYADNRRPYYLAGIVVMLGYVVGYFGWHLGGHRPYIFFGPGAASEAITLQWLLDHLLAGPLEFVAIVMEILAAVLLATLYVADRRSDGGDDTTDSE